LADSDVPKCILKNSDTIEIAFHEKILGQLFCDGSSKEIVAMLLKESAQAGVEIYLQTPIEKIEQNATGGFRLTSARGNLTCNSLVIASGGLSIPTMGATPFGYKVAEQFGLKVWPTRAGLVPFTLQPEDKEKYSALTGIALPASAGNQRQSFEENILFTHRGLSGPAILQLSSYWQPGETIGLKLLPEIALETFLKSAQLAQPKKNLKNILAQFFPKRVLEVFISTDLLEKPLKQLAPAQIKTLAASLQNWSIKPNGTEGYRTAEVTLGGVDCAALSSKTMEVKTMPGLYFIGEVVDVSGWLGGYNFQWAWSSGWVAGQNV